ncbi:hypothetical protein M1N24_00635 [Dehalococcoidia bacterium]|nr:hypothetical protein [Dehalococcoidia bacterium]
MSLCLLIESAYAHGFGERYDLPVPLWLYVVGAGMTVAFSFAAIGLFVHGAQTSNHYPRINLLQWQAGRMLVHPACLSSLKILSIAIFFLILIAGLIGTSIPMDNIAPTAVWVIWWVGLAYVCALIGNVWALINPWKILFEIAEVLYHRFDKEEELPLNLPYPQKIGVWPAVILLLCFAWIELVFPGSASPAKISQMAVAYSLVTWGGMFLFGKDHWLRHGEAFSLVFALLARFSPTELRVTSRDVCHSCPVSCLDLAGECIDCVHCFRRALGSRELNLRPFAVGLLRGEQISSSMVAFVVLLLATVTFDGFTTTPAWIFIHAALYSIFDSLSLATTIGLVALIVLFIGVYLIFSTFIAAASRARVPHREIARAFVFSLVPIALAYHLAHFLSFLLIQGQLIIPLASDPFGFGWDLLGTADYAVNIGVINARVAWFVAVATIVSGHIVAVYLGHTIAIRMFVKRRLAVRSQYPMLVLMVGYTMASLWIIAQPIVEA